MSLRRYTLFIADFLDIFKLLHLLLTSPGFMHCRIASDFPSMQQFQFPLLVSPCFVGRGWWWGWGWQRCVRVGRVGEEGD
jgi:hypothetical protein